MDDKQLKIIKKYKSKLKGLSEIEIYSFADYLDQWLKIWGKCKDKNYYGDLWKYFKDIKERGLKGDESYKKLGGFGFFLVNYILYSFDEYEYPITRKKGEPILMDCIIAFHILMQYLENEK